MPTEAVAAIASASTWKGDFLQSRHFVEVALSLQQFPLVAAGGGMIICIFLYICNLEYVFDYQTPIRKVRMTGLKKEYAAPEMRVVEVNAEAVICQSIVLVWFLTDPNTITDNNVEVGWGRGGYGSSDEI